MQSLRLKRFFKKITTETLTIGIYNCQLGSYASFGAFILYWLYLENDEL